MVSKLYTSFYPVGPQQLSYQLLSAFGGIALALSALFTLVYIVFLCLRLRKKIKSGESQFYSVAVKLSILLSRSHMHVSGRTAVAKHFIIVLHKRVHICNCIIMMVLHFFWYFFPVVVNYLLISVLVVDILLIIISLILWIAYGSDSGTVMLPGNVMILVHMKESTIARI